MVSAAAATVIKLPHVYFSALYDAGDRKMRKRSTDRSLPCDAGPVLHAAALEFVVLAAAAANEVVLAAEDVLGRGCCRQQHQEHQHGHRLAGHGWQRASPPPPPGGGANRHRASTRTSEKDKRWENLAYEMICNDNRFEKTNCNYTDMKGKEIWIR